MVLLSVWFWERLPRGFCVLLSVWIWARLWGPQMTPERGRGVKLSVVLVLAVLSAAATLAVVAQRSSDPMALDEASALALASGDESPAKREEIASGGTRFIAELRSSLDVARNGVCGASPRVSSPAFWLCSVFLCMAATPARAPAGTRTHSFFA